MNRRLLNIVIALLMIVGSASAQSLSVQSIEVQKGGEAELLVNLTGGTTMTALQFNLQLPAGLTATASSATLGTAADGHTLSVQTLDSGDLLFVLYSMDLKAFKNGELIRIPVTAGENATTATGKLYTVRTATADAVSNQCDNATFDVTVSGVVTGIVDVAPPNGNGQRINEKDLPVYNLNGQQVPKAQRGIYIIDGRKVVQ